MKQELGEILPKLEEIIRFSLLNNPDLHTSFGGKYGELWVATKLWRHDPKLARERYTVKGLDRQGSCDIILAGSKKKLEVKWAMYHHRNDDPFMKRVEGIPFWGWGFSSGKQFVERKFDYCILLAADKDKAIPQHVFVIRIDEMTESSMGRLRKSGVSSKGSFYIEFSNNKEYYHRRRWHPHGPSPLEESLFKQRSMHEERWKELKKNGILC